jgi:hypothetical protein
MTGAFAGSNKIIQPLFGQNLRFADAEGGIAKAQLQPKAVD